MVSSLFHLFHKRVSFEQYISVVARYFGNIVCLPLREILPSMFARNLRCAERAKRTKELHIGYGSIRFQLFRSFSCNIRFTFGKLNVADASLPLSLATLEHLQLLPAILRLDPGLARRTPVLRDERHIVG